MSKRTLSAQALNSRHKVSADGTHRWDIKTRNDANVLRVTYSPLSRNHTDNAVLIKTDMFRQNVLDRNKYDAKVFGCSVLRDVIAKVKQTRPNTQLLMVPQNNEFMANLFSDFVGSDKKKSEMMDYELPAGNGTVKVCTLQLNT